MTTSFNLQELRETSGETQALLHVCWEQAATQIKRMFLPVTFNVPDSWSYSEG